MRRPAARRLPAARPARARPAADRRCPSATSAIVPDRHGTGTNALVLRPPDAIRPAFGEGSCARHVAAAREAGIPFGVEELPSLGLDLDTPADLVALTRELEARPGRRPAHREGPGHMSDGRPGELRVRPVAGLPEFGEGTRLGEQIAGAGRARGRRRRRRLPEDRLQGRGTGPQPLLGHARRRGAQARRRARQGAGAGRADPRGEPRGAARRARRPDRRDPPRLRLRQRRHRQLQPARPGHRLPAAGGPRRLGPPSSGLTGARRDSRGSPDTRPRASADPAPSAASPS